MLSLLFKKNISDYLVGKRLKRQGRSRDLVGFYGNTPRGRNEGMNSMAMVGVMMRGAQQVY